jgi:general secretion pathway protein D
LRPRREETPSHERGATPGTRLYHIVFTAVILGLGACTDDVPKETITALSQIQAPTARPDWATPNAHVLTPPTRPADSRPKAEIIRGTPPTYHSRASGSAGVGQEKGDYTLNFENADIREVIKAVLGDTLQLDYTIDPAVQGTLTVHTGRGLARAAVLPAFEEALRLANVALVPRGHGYEAVPLQDAARRSGIAGESGYAPGFHVVLYPVKYISATEVQRVLEPVTQPGTIVRVDPARNLIVLAGTEGQLRNLVDTISIFDVDWLKSQSFGLFPLKFAPAKGVAAELSQVIGSDSPLAGIVKIQPVERLNAILVVSSQSAYIEEMGDWIDRFDRSIQKPTPGLYVYHVQNGTAAELAAVLAKAIMPGAGRATAPAAGNEAGGTDRPQAPEDQAAGAPRTSLQPSSAAPSAAAGAAAGSPFSDVQITADEANNALIILAHPESYKVIEAALQQLDTAPLQVLLEAAVAEVTLTNDLQYGVQFFVQDGQISVLRAATDAASLGLSPGGLSFLFSRGTNIRAVLDLLSTITDVRVVSSPEILVLNNRTASLQVGDEVPIATSSAVSTQTTGAPQVNTIQLRDTGVILKVTPRVNQGGLVLLEVSQEVSASVPTTTSGIDSPTIQERRVTSSVAVQDGQTIALGGLISDNRTISRTGIPVLGGIPIVGALFSDNENSYSRTELLVLITPHVIRDQKRAEEVTEELQGKLRLVRGIDIPKPR